MQTLLLPLPTSSTLPIEVLPNILTALIHHVHSKPAGYEPVLEVLDKSAKAELAAALAAKDDPVALSRLARSLKSVIVVAAIRKGRCVTRESSVAFSLVFSPADPPTRSPCVPSSQPCSSLGSSASSPLS